MTSHSFVQTHLI